MKRVFWISVTVLLMIVIMGVAFRIMTNIDEANKTYHEEQAGKAVASQIVAVATDPTTIWDKLRATQASEGMTVPVEVPSDQPMEEGQDESQDPNEQEVISPEVSEENDDQTSTVAETFEVNMN